MDTDIQVQIVEVVTFAVEMAAAGDLNVAVPDEAGYTPQKGIDYFDGAKGDKGDKGDQGEMSSLPAGLLVSIPPSGCYKVTNIYVNANRKLCVDYEEFPI